MRISDWSSDVCSSDLEAIAAGRGVPFGFVQCTKQILHTARKAWTVYLEAMAPADGRGSPLVINDIVRVDAFHVLLGAGAEFIVCYATDDPPLLRRSEEHTSELQQLKRISSDVSCLKKNTISDS